MFGFIKMSAHGFNSYYVSCVHFNTSRYLALMLCRVSVNGFMSFGASGSYCISFSVFWPYVRSSCGVSSLVYCSFGSHVKFVVLLRVLVILSSCIRHSFGLGVC